MHSSSITVDLKDLALKGGERFERVYPIEMPPIILGGQSYDVLFPNGVRVEVDRVAGGYLVTVAARASLYGPCDRCLREAGIEVEVEQQEFVPTTTREGWDERDLSPFIEDLVVDVTGLTREATVLALPSRIVCSPECRGLCASCGRDLNTGTCDCDGEQVDERLAILRDLDLGDR